MGKKWRELRKDKEADKREIREGTVPKRFRSKPKKKRHGTNR